MSATFEIASSALNNVWGGRSKRCDQVFGNAASRAMHPVAHPPHQAGNGEVLLPQVQDDGSKFIDIKDTAVTGIRTWLSGTSQIRFAVFQKGRDLGCELALEFIC